MWLWGECPLLQPGCPSLLPSLGHPHNCPFPSSTYLWVSVLFPVMHSCRDYSACGTLGGEAAAAQLQSQSLLQFHPIPMQVLPPCTPLPWQQALHHCSVPCPGCPVLQPLPNNPLVTRTSPVKKKVWGGFNLPSPGCLPGAWPHKAPSSGR